ncbi:hypothetical protein F1188_07145 [Roseospira marina]|uniref:Uncharacterized protein n=1 Tax=Roseospira marina TaxID=140057 RepID=A0A5M6ID42_9PROT|nr:hypothetical protein [Roseospira marina]KAA5606194.1 hypothetical protein F1188_07145 [Roseospira marina]MBB4314339.1 hypothetical protein [Roseospira marina]MBB5087499.1 hypothetical protein [Roseospira marina]
MTRAGGPIPFTVNDGVYDAAGYDATLDGLKAEGRAPDRLSVRRGHLRAAHYADGGVIALV